MIFTKSVRERQTKCLVKSWKQKSISNFHFNRVKWLRTKQCIPEMDTMRWGKYWEESEMSHHTIYMLLLFSRAFEEGEEQNRDNTKQLMQSQHRLTDKEMNRKQRTTTSCVWMIGFMVHWCVPSFQHLLFISDICASGAQSVQFKSTDLAPVNISVRWMNPFKLDTPPVGGVCYSFKCIIVKLTPVYARTRWKWIDIYIHFREVSCCNSCVGGKLHRSDVAKNQ